MIPSPHLDAGSEVPLYKQLYEHFSGLIESGRLARGERLPPTRELAGSLGLNRTTISAAYDLLETEGWITGHVGRGSFVAGRTAAAHGLDWERLLRPDHTLAAPAPPFGRDGISFATSRPSE